MIRKTMGFLSSKKITTYIYGKDHRTGKIVYQEEYDSFGSLMGQWPTIDERITYLDKKYPNLSWEYESWKD